LSTALNTGKKQSDGAPVISSIDQLTAYLAAGSKPKDEWRIGTEHEKFVYCRQQLCPVPYDGEIGIRNILEKLSVETGWEIIRENGLPIGLKGGGASVSLEPGGQAGRAV